MFGSQVEDLTYFPPRINSVALAKRWPILARLHVVEKSSRRVVWPLVLALLIIAAGGVLRFAYYDSLFQHPDETITTEVVRHMRQSGDWDVNWVKADLGKTYRYDQYNFSSHLYANFLAYRLVKLLPGTLRWRS